MSILFNFTAGQQKKVIEIQKRENHLWLLVVYILVDNYGAKTREEREGQAKIRSQVGDGEGQNQMLL